jgi:hypothetical protein
MYVVEFQKLTFDFHGSQLGYEILRSRVQCCSHFHTSVNYIIKFVSLSSLRSYPKCINCCRFTTCDIISYVDKADFMNSA